MPRLKLELSETEKVYIRENRPMTDIRSISKALDRQYETIRVFCKREGIDGPTYVNRGSATNA